jgi:hypothetical protein
MHTNIEREEEKEEINDEKKITHKEAIASFDNLFKYLEDSEDFNDKDLNSLLNLKDFFITHVYLNIIFKL